MNNLYDNGTILLGTKKDIVNQIYNNMLEEEQDELYQDILEDLKGYMETFDNVNEISIKKQNNHNTLIIDYDYENKQIYIPLKEIRLCWLVNIDTMEEYFRYEK